MHTESNSLYYDLPGGVGSVSTDAVSTTNATTFRLPNGLLINNPNGKPFAPAYEYGTIYMTAFGTGNATKTNNLKDNDSLIFAMSFLKLLLPTNASALWPNIPVGAIECGLFYCVNQYTSKINSGRLTESETRVKNATRNPNSWQPIPFGSDTLLQGFVPNTSMIESIGYNSAIAEQQRTDLMFGDQFNVSQYSVFTLSSYFQNNFRNPKNFNYSQYARSIRTTAMQATWKR
jgi:hypothetical protein